MTSMQSGGSQSGGSQSGGSQSGGPTASPSADHLSPLAPLVGLEHRPLAEHADAFEQVHSTLQAALSDIDGA